MAESLFNQIGTTISGKLFTSVIWMGVALILISLIVGLIWYYTSYRKKFDILLKIISERAGDPKIFFDMGAILYDKKNKINFLRLRNSKMDLPDPPYSIIQKTNFGDYIELLKRSENEYIYLAPGTINKFWILKLDGKEYPIGQADHRQIEGDIEYWNTKTKDRMKKLFDPESLWMKILPYIPHIIAGVLVIFILYILMDSLPGILANLKELSIELKSSRTASYTTIQ